MSRRQKAFTLIELLVVVSIVAVLAALLSSALSGVRTKLSATREASAAKQLMTAFHSYAAENDGALLPGYGDFPATDDRGAKLGNPENHRYPWRIAPYLHYDLRILWGNNSDDQLKRLAAGPREAYLYGISVQPALGMNILFVGGDYESMAPDEPLLTTKYGNFCLTHMGQAEHPAQTLVFASAATTYNDQRLPGFFKLDPPYLKGRRWATQWDARTPADQTGYVDFRYDGKAVAAMLDGHVEMLNFEQMGDMRHWSAQAAEANLPAWILGKTK